MSFWSRIFKPSEKSLPPSVGGGGYHLPVSGGWIPANWPWNFWQQGRDPISGGRSPVVEACVSAYAQTLASLSLRHIRSDGSGGKEIITTSAAARWVRSPNSYQTRSDFILQMVRSLLYTGNAYALAIRNDRNEVIAMHPVNPRSTQVYVEPESQAVFYGLGDNPLVARELVAMVPQRDVWHVKINVTRHPLRGTSPIENLGMTIMANQAIASHQANFFSNMSRPSGVLSTTEVLNGEQMDQLRKAWEDQSQSFNSGLVPILSAGLQWQQLSLTSQDAQMIEASRMTVEGIAQAFRVPMPLIGDTKDSSYGSSTESLISLWLSSGLGFMMEHIESSLASFFGFPYADSFEFDADSLLRTDFEKRIAGLTKGIAGGLYSPNEARRREGLKAVDFGDEPRVQAQVVPLSNVGKLAEPTPSAPAAPVNDPEPPTVDDATGKVVALANIKGFLNERAG